MTSPSFQSYLRELPLLHSWDGGKSWNTGGFEADLLESLHAAALRLGPGARILETGAGNSTIALLFSDPARLVSIAPDAELFERIEAACGQLGLPSQALERVCQRSEMVLPDLAAKAERDGELFDLALIDGGHGWPTVFVDFCYANRALRKGGMLWIDDVQLHSVVELVHLLERQPEFRLIEDHGKTLGYEKLTDAPFLSDHARQPYLIARSKRPEWRRRLQKMQKKMLRH